MSPHWDEFMASEEIRAAREWFERAQVSDELKPAALAVWAAWFGGSLLMHAEASVENGELRVEPQEKPDGGRPRRPREG